MIVSFLRTSLPTQRLSSTKMTSECTFPCYIHEVQQHSIVKWTTDITTFSWLYTKCIHKALHSKNKPALSPMFDRYELGKKSAKGHFSGWLDAGVLLKNLNWLQTQKHGIRTQQLQGNDMYPKDLLLLAFLHSFTEEKCFNILSCL